MKGDIIMTFEEVKQFLESEAGSASEVTAYLQGLNPLTVARMQEFVEKTPEAKSWLDSVKDKHLQKGLETWKTNNLETLIDAEVKKKFPQKDEKEIELDKLRAEIDQMKQEKLKESLTNKAMKMANEKNLPIELVGFFIGRDEQETTDNLKVLEDIYNSSVQKTLELRLKGEGYVPPKDNGGGSRTDLDSLSMDEYIKARNKN
ncbi:protein of unknown function [Desulfotomaculum arcticum]|uniref:DUF4355 domain-containing protein n=1 Tax=Desulfotruncus arcticus DSM 17038 TaxID=1121424 RepID=A0A1I2VTE4_9FIRM|nr:DUF4355 domain-containing protein [Desulfotruncus arcticus]SFG92333.1 protein of unknown function [Desulfotomaculum arcticum] [Desulfotruncus arcticus DSM 17038]